QISKITNIEDLESGNVEHTDEVLSLDFLSIKCLIASPDDPLEHAGIDSLRQSHHCPVHLFEILSLVDPFRSDTDTGLRQRLQEFLVVDTEVVARVHRILLSIVLGLLLSRSLLELHLSHVHDTGAVLVQVHDLVVLETHDVECLLSKSHFLLIVHSINGELCLRHEVVVLHFVRQFQISSEGGVAAGHDLVEDVVASLSGRLTDDTRLLEKVLLNVSSGQLSSGREVSSDELSESGRVVVTDSLRVTESLEYGIGLNDLFLECSSLLSLCLGSRGLRSSHKGEVRNDLLGVLCLSCARLSSDQHRLVLLVLDHVTVGLVGGGEEMRGHLGTTLAHVVLDDGLGVDGQ
ncbi:hypothetical protein PFISCL1PPCAC_737, partial [Pristionchus fissidentatus]